MSLVSKWVEAKDTVKQPTKHTTTPYNGELVNTKCQSFQAREALVQGVQETQRKRMSNYLKKNSRIKELNGALGEPNSSLTAVEKKGG